MKKIFFTVAAFYLVFLTPSCTKDDVGAIDENLIGVWYDVRDYADRDQTRTREWSFREDGIMEIAYLEFEKSSGNFLGYSVLYSGDYNVNGDILVMKNMIGYSYSFDGEDYLPNAPYLASKEALLSREGGDPGSHSASISYRLNGKLELVLTYFECSDTGGNCVGSETLTRK